jgi:hypothetical protein
MKSGLKLMKQLFFGEMTIKVREGTWEYDSKNTAKVLSIADRPS